MCFRSSIVASRRPSSLMVTAASERARRTHSSRAVGSFIRTMRACTSSRTSSSGR